jgi:hypothetical protein
MPTRCRSNKNSPGKLDSQEEMHHWTDNTRTKVPIHQGTENLQIFTKICMVIEDCTRVPDYSFFVACDGRQPSTFSSNAEREVQVWLSCIYTFRLYVPMHVHPHQTEEFWDSWTSRSSVDGYDLFTLVLRCMHVISMLRLRLGTFSLSCVCKYLVIDDFLSRTFLIKADVSVRY